MDVLKQVWERIQGLFKRLSPSQQFTLGLLGIVVAFALWMLVSLSMRNGMAPLTRDASTPPEVMAGIRSFLEERGVPYENRDGVLFVPSAQRDKLWYDLQKEGQPLAGKDVYEWLQGPSWGMTKGQRDLLYMVSVKHELERWLRSLDDIENANVTLPPPGDPSTVALTEQRGKASVTLQLKPGKALDRGNVMAIAALVSHSVPNLRPQDVAIMDTQGRPYAVPEENDAYERIRSLTEAEREKADALEQSIRKILGDIKPDPLITVNVPLDLDERSYVDTIYFPDQSAPVVEQRSKQSEQGAVTARPPGGIMALSADASAPSSQITSSLDRSATRIDQSVSHRVTTVKEHPARVRNLTATVILPQQYLTANKLKVEDFRSQITHAIGLSDVLNLEVSARPFPEPPALAEPPAWAVGVDFLRGNWASMLLGLLILTALGMIYGIVQRAIPGDIAAEIERMRAQLAAQAQEEALAVEGPVDTRMVAMKQTVKTLVQKSPSTVASILRRWMLRG